ASERPSDSPPIPSPPYPSEDQPQIQPDLSPRPSPTTYILDSIPEGSGGNHGGQSSNDASLLGNEDDPAFDDLDYIVDDEMDYMKSKDAQDKERTSSVVVEEKESADKEVSTEAPVSIVKPNEGTDKQDGGTDSTKVSIDRQVLITISQNKQKEKQKGVEVRNAKDTERTRSTSTRSILTLIPLPKIDPKDKGKKRIKEEDESDTESEDFTEAEKKFKQLANDEEVARKVQEEWEAKEEKKRLDEEEATKSALSNEYYFIQARLNADKILTEKLQEEERERYEKMINEIYKQAADASKKRVKKDDCVKGEIKEEEGTRKRKLGKRKKMKYKK
ncbi:hypothetical protein Tco_1527213, partial [Tanacetum coccineum]